jgi:hypothetical protein
MTIRIEYEEDVALAWAELLTECADDHGAANFSWHLAETGCAPATVRSMAQRWRDEEFVPREFADQLEAFALTVEGLLSPGAERAWPRP